MLHGAVIEVGAGDGRLKQEVLAGNPNVSKYVATDYSGWDRAFEAGGQLAESDRLFDQLHLRSARIPLDRTCSALDLPFESSSFDWHVSSEVLEHIPDTEGFFREAARVVRRGGGVMLTAPFMYRVHPDMDSDFFRVLPAGYAAIAARHGLVVERLVANTGVGASCAALINQRLIRIHEEAPPRSIRRLLALACMPLVFLSSNLLGLVLDRGAPDQRFATRFLVVMRKK